MEKETKEDKKEFEGSKLCIYCGRQWDKNNGGHSGILADSGKKIYVCSTCDGGARAVYDSVIFVVEHQRKKQ